MVIRETVERKYMNYLDKANLCLMYIALESLDVGFHVLEFCVESILKYLI